MNTEMLLLRLSEDLSPSVNELELKSLVSHIAYLEKVCGALLGAITEVGLRVNVPAKEQVLRPLRGTHNDAKAWGDEWARETL